MAQPFQSMLATQELGGGRVIGLSAANVMYSSLSPLARAIMLDGIGSERTQVDCKPMHFERHSCCLYSTDTFGVVCHA
jgi:hypothetical protein